MLSKEKSDQSAPGPLHPKRASLHSSWRGLSIDDDGVGRGGGGGHDHVAPQRSRSLGDLNAKADDRRPSRLEVSASQLRSSQFRGMVPATTRELLQAPMDALAPCSRRERQFRISKNGKCMEMDDKDELMLKPDDSASATALNLHRREGMLQDLIKKRRQMNRGNPLRFAPMEEQYTRGLELSVSVDELSRRREGPRKGLAVYAGPSTIQLPRSLNDSAVLLPAELIARTAADRHARRKAGKADVAEDIPAQPAHHSAETVTNRLKMATNANVPFLSLEDLLNEEEAELNSTVVEMIPNRDGELVPLRRQLRLSEAAASRKRSASLLVSVSSNVAADSQEPTAPSRDFVAFANPMSMPEDSEAASPDAGALSAKTTRHRKVLIVDDEDEPTLLRTVNAETSSTPVDVSPPVESPRLATFSNLSITSSHLDTSAHDASSASGLGSRKSSMQTKAAGLGSGSSLSEEQKSAIRERRRQSMRHSIASSVNSKRGTITMDPKLLDVVRRSCTLFPPEAEYKARHVNLLGDDDQNFDESMSLSLSTASPGQRDLDDDHHASHTPGALSISSNGGAHHKAMRRRASDASSVQSSEASDSVELIPPYQAFAVEPSAEAEAEDDPSKESSAKEKLAVSAVLAPPAPTAAPPPPVPVPSHEDDAIESEMKIMLNDHTVTLTEEFMADLMDDGTGEAPAAESLQNNNERMLSPKTPPQGSHHEGTEGSKQRRRRASAQVTGSLAVGAFGAHPTDRRHSSTIAANAADVALLTTGSAFRSEVRLLMLKMVVPTCRGKRTSVAGSDAESCDDAHSRSTPGLTPSINSSSGGSIKEPKGRSVKGGKHGLTADTNYVSQESPLFRLNALAAESRESSHSQLQAPIDASPSNASPTTSSAAGAQEGGHRSAQSPSAVSDEAAAAEQRRGGGEVAVAVTSNCVVPATGVSGPVRNRHSPGNQRTPSNRVSGGELAALVLQSGRSEPGRDAANTREINTLLADVTKSHMHVLVTAAEVDWVVRRTNAIAKTKKATREAESAHQVLTLAELAKKAVADEKNKNEIFETSLHDRQEALLEALGAWHSRIAFRLVETEQERAERETRMDGGAAILVPDPQGAAGCMAVAAGGCCAVS